VARRERNILYSRALVEAQAAYPNDGVAAHRMAMRVAAAADRRKPMSTGRTPSEEERKTIDAALLEAFPEDTAGERGRLSIVQEFPDHITARGGDGELYKIDFTVALGVKNFTFGTPEEIEDGPEDEPDGSGGKKR
jgi:hypothetical protein